MYQDTVCTVSMYRQYQATVKLGTVKLLSSSCSRLALAKLSLDFAQRPQHGKGITDVSQPHTRTVIEDMERLD